MPGLRSGVEVTGGDGVGFGGVGGVGWNGPALLSAPLRLLKSLEYAPVLLLLHKAANRMDMSWLANSLHCEIHNISHE